METRPPAFASRLFQRAGLGAVIPKPSGPHSVRSTHFRIPGEHGVFVQCFFPLDTKLAAAANTTNSIVTVGRTYRNGVIRGASEFASTSYLLMRMVLEGSTHPLSEYNHAPVQIAEVPEEKFPVILFSHGLGGSAETYTKQCIDMASLGYVVIALEHEDGSGAHAKTVDGKLVSYIRPPVGMAYTTENVIRFRAPFLAKRVAEVKAAVDFVQHSDFDVCRLMDRSRIAMAGHSFGAATATCAARALPPNTFCGVLLLDVWAFPVPNLELGMGAQLPVCSLLSEQFYHNNETAINKLLISSSNAMSFYVPGTVHSSFSDTPWWLPPWLGRRVRLVGAQDRDVVQQTVLAVEADFLAHVFTKPPPNESLKKMESNLLERFEHDHRLDLF